MTAILKNQNRREFMAFCGLGAALVEVPRLFAGSTEPAIGSSAETAEIDSVCNSTVEYLLRCQDFKPGEYYGAFWSEKAYHGPLLNYDAGGSHHHRGAGSGGLALWLLGRRRNDPELKHRAELAFDWLASRQRPSGGYQEIQNNEKPSDWELTGLEECSTIEAAFVAHGLSQALLTGLPPKKLYQDCLQRIGMWELALERPVGSGIFPHHDRSPYDCLNANLHAAETLMGSYCAGARIFSRRTDILLQGCIRAVRHTLPLQWPNGCFPYRSTGGSTINYTSLVLWCLLNVLDLIRNPQTSPGVPASVVASSADLSKAFDRATSFLRSCVSPTGDMLWEGNETSSAKYNLWTYALTYNVLLRIGGEANRETAARIKRAMLSRRTKSGLLPMRDRGKEITECAFMQADMLLFLLPSSSLLAPA